MTASERTISTSRPRRKDLELPPGYVADSTSIGPMLQYEKSLPRLPVPALASTAAKYLETVEPHVSPEAYAKTKRAVEKFIASEQGKELQRRLEARAAEPDRGNWLIDWWNDSAYMGYRDPVVVNVSYFYVHVEDKKIRTPAKRAATLIKALLPFRELVETCVMLFFLSYQLTRRGKKAKIRTRQSSQYSNRYVFIQVVVCVLRLGVINLPFCFLDLTLAESPWCHQIQQKSLTPKQIHTSCSFVITSFMRFPPSKMDKSLARPSLNRVSFQLQKELFSTYPIFSLVRLMK